MDKEQELQKIKQDLVVVEAHHRQEVQLLKYEHEERLKQLQKKNDYLKNQLENSDFLNHQKANQIDTFEQYLKESQLASTTSSFSRLTTE